MLTSSRLAPPRTCSSATSTAPWWSSASISRRNRAEPVTLVRSPIITKPVSGPISNGSRPLNRVARPAARRPAAAAGPATAAAICAMCAGRRAAAAADDVDQPGVGELAEQLGGLLRRLVVAAERVGQAGVGVAGRRTCRRAGPARRRAGASRPRRASSSRRRPAARRARSSARTPRPSARTASGRSGRRWSPRSTAAGRGATSRAAAIAALALSVSKIVSISSRSTPPSASAWICSAYAAVTSSNVTARYAGSSTRGDSDSVTFSGPTEPATNRPPASSAACRASWAPRRFISRTSDCRP